MEYKSTIMIEKETIEMLKNAKEYPRQTYNDLLKRLVEVFNGVNKKNQYDEFLHKIQLEKMSELWDNDSDEAWDNA